MTALNERVRKFTYKIGFKLFCLISTNFSEFTFSKITGVKASIIAKCTYAESSYPLGLKELADTSDHLFGPILMVR
jgi:hypothetical protein